MPRGRSCAVPIGRPNVAKIPTVAGLPSLNVRNLLFARRVCKVLVARCAIVVSVPTVVLAVGILTCLRLRVVLVI